MRLFDEVIAARMHTGHEWGDQTLFNEVLLQWQCHWTMWDGSPATLGKKSVNSKLVRTGLKAHCSGSIGKYSGKKLRNLSLAVLPQSVVGRRTPNAADLAHFVASHPGGGNKEATFQIARCMCVNDSSVAVEPAD